MYKSEKVWDGMSERYSRQSISDEEAHKKIIENIKQYLNIGDVILDYACGTGTISIKLAENVKQVQAIDISSKMLDIASRKTQEKNIENISYVQSTLFDKRLKDESFNIVIAFYILHLLDDTQEAVKRINELLKPGGLFISTTACMGEKNSFFRIFMLLLSKLGIVPYLKILKYSELQETMIDANFQILDKEKLKHSDLEYYIVAKKL